MIKQLNIKSAVESILFVSGEPVSCGKIAKILNIEKDMAKEAAKELASDCLADERGVRILEKGDEFQMVSCVENAKFLEEMAKGDLKGELSQQALETLAIVAYKGPLTRHEIDNIRGVNSSFMLRNLLIRGLIERDENKNDLRSYVYSISFDFMKKLGLEKISDLPNYVSLNESLDESVEKMEFESLQKREAENQTQETV